ncbi:MAG: IS200/IS605 family element transposase accessory protein TnpB [Thaumarchaeota archaeon]|nr:MAG: IS200/IS605 family element transposase accessory protein TnpB [Nitrososphaerota archaeon]
MQAVKAVKQNYRPTEEILSLLEDFRCMVNDCVRIGLKENLTSMKSLSMKAYHQLSAYDAPTYYRLTAISRAAGILRNYRKELKRNRSARVPYVTRLSLTDCYGFRVIHRLVRLPVRKGEYVFIVLNDHTLRTMSGRTPRSLTLTANGLSICLSKETAEIEPVGAIGIDRNLDNVTTADSDGSILRHDLGRATEVKARSRETKRHFKRNDVRIRRVVYGKYGRIQRNRVAWLLHNVSASIVKRAKEKRFGIVMENIEGIRRLYRKGNGQGTTYRARLNSWSFYELQRQIEYKARWEGVPVSYVAARGTSVNCSICGSRTTKYPNGRRTLHCPRCDISIDRDVNAARNILAKGGVRFTPDGPPEVCTEAMKGNETTTPILRVDGGKVTPG